ncbi:hypothetical protein A7981_04915 [Methylovorus sp. MM2]|uniref:M48 family metallopeptidase n=1 Tax=Methylovorus sp. MM2 TaxID=1848038 RepID=UPI0007DEE730|nr:M48 family metallopeptidase [Methylovorus sp. MM2]OAM52787.1 hypothetical protein A7981_04915 [Methylovorus sp. MM2]
MEFQADYFDGISPRARKVLVTVGERTISFIDTDIDADGEQQVTLDFSEIHLQSRLGKARRVIELADGSRLESDDINGFDAVYTRGVQSTFRRLLHYFENHLGWVAAALLLTIACGWGFIKYGVPVIAEYVAYATPIETERKMGEQVLAGMDHQYGYFKPSELKPERIAAIKEAVHHLCDKQREACPDYRLEVRNGGVIGANAFALPGGIIVLTDALVDMAKSDDEIVSVLAHEIGHVKRRHAFRQTLQGALAGLILVAVTGDFDSFASGLPAILLQLSYSRDMEREADYYALESMHSACIQPHVFIDILQRLSAQSDFSVPEIVSSHPDTNARLKPFKVEWLDCKS